LYCPFIYYCDSLSGNWRLPSRIELASLIDYGDSNPAMSDKFIYTTSDTYWTSTMSVQTSNNYWVVNFKYGTESTMDMTNSSFVRCVETMKTPVANAGGDRIIENGDKILLSGRYSTMKNSIKSYKWSDYYNNIQSNWAENSEISIDNIKDSFLDGIHHIKLRIEDNNGNESIDNAIITIISNNKDIKVHMVDSEVICGVC